MNESVRQTPGDGHVLGEEPQMPIPYRPEVPPTEQVLRGKARLLEQLSAIADGSSDPTLRSDEPDHPTTMTWNLHVRDENRYAFGEVFATGGLGVVRRGQDRRLGRPI